ncbi:MAG: hypothetical protein KAJ28_08630 [Flavobacteriaceae bacterium]|nr:hypothetical protein [Flavobacteriaceae bacterium]
MLAIIILLISACKNESNNNVTKTTKTQEITKYDTLAISLNNNEKWIANKETHVGVSKMDSLISSFDNDKYQYLTNNLSELTSYIIKNCSMKGEPHDQLHIVLVPMLDEISALKETTDNEERKTIIKNLQALIDIYFQHFKT